MSHQNNRDDWHEDEVGFWRWSGGVIVYRDLKPPYAKSVSSQFPSRRHGNRRRAAALIALAAIILLASRLYQPAAEALGARSPTVRTPA